MTPKPPEEDYMLRTTVSQPTCKAHPGSDQTRHKRTLYDAKPILWNAGTTSLNAKPTFLNADTILLNARLTAPNTEPTLVSVTLTLNNAGATFTDVGPHKFY